MKKLFPVLFALAVIYFFYPQHAEVPDAAAPALQERQGQDRGVDSVRREEPDLRPGAQAQGQGTVERVLADDNDGSRHQRFIIRLSSGRTLLIAHNIDLAPRVAGLQAGDIVEFNGEFESNPQGGVIHWTHRDPNGRHIDGWLRHNGRTYQ